MTSPISWMFRLALSVCLVSSVVNGFAAPATTTTESGLKYIDLAVGDGRVPAGNDFVKVHYEGKIKRTGKVFGGTRGREDYRAEAYKGTPFSFKLGSKQVVTGWEEGIRTMRVGGKRRLLIPAELAYGKDGSPDGVIPKNADLEFDVELVEITGNMNAVGLMGTGFKVAFGMIAANGLTALVTGHELREYVIGAV